MLKGSVKPKKFNGVVERNEESILLFDKEDIKSTNPVYSEAVHCGAYRHFRLSLDIDSTSTPTDLRIEVLFLEEQTGKWFTYKQGFFASLYYEDTDVASGVQECFSGDCSGRAMRIKLTGSGTTSSAFFTVSAAVEFWN